MNARADLLQRRRPVSVTLQRICLWSGPLFAVAAFGGMFCAGWLPPPSANQSATTVAAMYMDDTERIRMGAVLMGMSSLFEGAWAALMSCQLRRIEGDRPLLTYTQLAAGAAGIIVLIIPAFLFAAAAFTPTRDPEITKALHDFGWLALVGVGWPVVLQSLAVAGAVLTDTSARPVFARWFGWLNIWGAFAFLPGPFLVFFHTGPFAWNGAVVFWAVAIAFGLWMAGWFVALWRAIDSEAAEVNETGGAADPVPPLASRAEVAVG
jgi:hypothetical protein